MGEREPRAAGIWLLLLLCPLAAAANAGLSLLVQYKLHLSLFLDTLFNAAVTFSAGFLPGIATAVLTFVICALRGEPPETHFFVLCSIAEIFLIWIFRRRFKKAWASSTPSAAPAPYSFIAVASSLLILALMDCAVISILGGSIDTAVFLVFSPPRNQFSPEGVFRLGLLRNGVPILWANVLSRFPINLVDRFIVVFGGCGVSLFIGKLYAKRDLRILPQSRGSQIEPSVRSRIEPSVRS
jgi:hypothetical protein